MKNRESKNKNNIEKDSRLWLDYIAGLVRMVQYSEESKGPFTPSLNVLSVSQKERVQRSIGDLMCVHAELMTRWF